MCSSANIKTFPSGSVRYKSRIHTPVQKPVYQRNSSYPAVALGGAERHHLVFSRSLPLLGLLNGCSQGGSTLLNGAL